MEYDYFIFLSVTQTISDNQKLLKNQENFFIFIITGHQDILDDSLSIKLRAGGMPATTARLVEACAPHTLNESQKSVRSLRHQRQVSDSVLKDLRGDDDDDDDDEVETKSVGTPSTLPRLSRPSSIASPATGSSKHNTLVG